MTYIDARFVEQIFDMSMRKWDPDLMFQSQAKGLGRHLEVAKRKRFRHHDMQNDVLPGSTKFPLTRASCKLARGGQPLFFKKSAQVPT